MNNSTTHTLETGGGDYYSGQDAAIWMGEGNEAIFLGHAIGLEYNLQEMVMPLLGYGDYTMRRRAHGMRIVHGSMSVIYQQTVLMYQLLEQVTGNLLPQITVAEPITPAHIPALGSVIRDASATLAVIGSIHPSQTRQLLSNLSTQVKSAAGPGEYTKNVSAIRNAAEQKKSAWKSPGIKTSNHSPTPSILTQIQGRLSSLYSKYETLPEGFTITIDFGNPPIPTAPNWPVSQVLPLSYAQAANEMSFTTGPRAEGQTTIQRALAASPSWTTRRIVGVSLTGMQQVIDDSGRVMLESYSFIASDLI